MAIEFSRIVNNLASNLQGESSPTYEADYVAWIGVMVEHLRDRNYGAVDWENLIEEIEEMGKRERRSLESNLIVLLLHLLKWQFQPERRSGSWQGSIVEHRRRLLRSLQDSPSLKPYVEAVFGDCYQAAVEQAIAETGLQESVFPEASPYGAEQVLRSGFLPTDD